MKKVKVVLVLIIFFFGGFFYLRNVLLTRAQDRSADNNLLARWRPTEELAGVGFVGNQKCVECHVDQKTQLDTPMAHALLQPVDSKMLEEFPPKPFKLGEYTYEVEKQNDKIVYTVSDGKTKNSFPILYSFGEGRKGQVYIFKYNNALYESRVTLYRTLRGLSFTVAQPQQQPTSLESAIGREIPMPEAENCFKCHSTGAIKDKKFQFEHLDEAVSCEACHGAGERHINAVKTKDFKNLEIFNPANLSAFEQTQEFCGACHVGFEMVLNLPKDVNTIRFQPYRLFMSRAHSSTDARLSCTACHNPHEKLQENPVAYDTKCFACHVATPKEKLTKERFAPACPVKTSSCVSCHMPKTDIPEMHFKFTDHQIQIVRPDKKSE